MGITKQREGGREDAPDAHGAEHARPAGPALRRRRARDGLLLRPDDAERRPVLHPARPRHGGSEDGPPPLPQVGFTREERQAGGPRRRRRRLYARRAAAVLELVTM